MSEYDGSIDERLQRYCEQNDLTLERRLGFGKDGTVWTTSRMTAVKVHARIATYVRERDVYIRLADEEVDRVAGHAVPRLLVADDALGALEMEIVEPPFVLDFASAQLDIPFDFPPEIMEEWLAEEAGAVWGAVAGCRSGDSGVGAAWVYMIDVHPGNIRSSNDS